MPVAPLVGSVPGHDHFVAEARGDLVIAAGTPIGFDGLVGLHVRDIEIAGGGVGHPKTAQSTSNATTASATATTTMSVLRFACARNGFSPIGAP